MPSETNYEQLVIGTDEMHEFLDFARKDVEISSNAPTVLQIDNHERFIRHFTENKQSYEYVTTECLRLSGIYWCVESMDIIGRLDLLETDEIAEYVKSCHHASGGYAPAVDHDPHLLNTLNAVQILIALNKIHEIDCDQIANFVVSLQNDDGSFGGDPSNEIDTRFSFCALAVLHLINRLDAVNIAKAVEFVMKCYNFDGGFGTRPGSESHAGQVYCCLGFLAIAESLNLVDTDRTAQWLAERQCFSGGLNGRPEKLPDVCYSWWVLASLVILDRLSWIDSLALKRFALACQDDEDGGFADRPGDVADPYHTLFGLAGLSLLDLNIPGLEPVDAVFCMTKKSLGDLSFC